MSESDTETYAGYVVVTAAFDRPMFHHPESFDEPGGYGTRHMSVALADAEGFEPCPLCFPEADDWTVGDE